MTNQIIHDPTRGWLLLTEKWPEKEYLEDSPLWNAILDGEIAHCLSTAIEIQREDWLTLLITIEKGKVSNHSAPAELYKDLMQYVQDHHPYSVDAEFEVVTQWKTYTMWSYKEHKGCITRQIARLVKAKEYRLERPVEGGIVGTEIGVKDTESQDELWREVNDECCLGMDDDYTLDIEEAKKRYRIERI